MRLLTMLGCVHLLDLPAPVLGETRAPQSTYPRPDTLPNVVYTGPTLASTQRNLSAVLAQTVSVLDYGATTDCLCKRDSSRTAGVLGSARSQPIPPFKESCCPHDSTAAFNSALESGGLSGIAVLVPSGSYRIDGTVLLRGASLPLPLSFSSRPPPPSLSRTRGELARARARSLPELAHKRARTTTRRRRAGVFLRGHTHPLDPQREYLLCTTYMYIIHIVHTWFPCMLFGEGSDPIIRIDGAHASVSGPGTLLMLNAAPRGIVNIGPTNRSHAGNIVFNTVADITIIGPGPSWCVCVVARCLLALKYTCRTENSY